MAVLLSPVGGVAAQFFTNAGVPLSGGKIYTYAAGTSTPQATYTTNAGNIQHSNPIVLDAAGRVPTGEIWLTDGQSYKFVLKDSNDVLIATYDNIVGINSNFVNYLNQQEIQTATAGQTVFTLTTMTYQPGTNSLSVFVDGVNQYGPGAQYAFVETNDATVTFLAGLHVGAEVKFTTSQLQNASSVDASQVTYTYPAVDAIQESVEDRLAQYVSVKDFGAVGDGVTDDYDAFIAAIKTNKAIYVPEGTYLIGSPINFATLFTSGYIIRNFVLRGAGQKKTIIKFTGTGTMFTGFTTAQSSTYYQKLTISDISFEGNGSVGNSSTQTFGAYTIRASSIAGTTNTTQTFMDWIPDVSSVFTRCEVKYFNYGIKFNSLYAWEISNCNIQYNNFSIVVSGANTTSTIFGNNIDRSGIGIALWTCFAMYIENNVLEANDAGCDIYAYNWTGQVFVKNNWMSELSYEGLVVQGDSGGQYANQAWVIEGNTGIKVSLKNFATNFYFNNNLFDKNTSFYINDSGISNILIGTNWVFDNSLILTPFNNFSGPGTKYLTFVSPSGSETVFDVYNKNTGGFGTEALTKLAFVNSNQDYVNATIEVTDQSNSATRGYLYIATNDGGSVTRRMQVSNLGIGPAVDNVGSCGSNLFRWSQIYAVSGTINTSDANEKTQIVDLSDAEKRVAAILKTKLKRFKFKDAVKKKGDNARYHFGVIAQDVKTAFESEGLIAEEYGVFCSDTWYVDDNGNSTDCNVDKNGNIIPGLKEKTRLGVRYEELLAFIISAV